MSVPGRHPLLSAAQDRRLDRFWKRQKQMIADAADAVTRANLRQIMKPTGELKNIASRVGGDLLGVFGNALVVGLRGHRIENTTPVEGDTVVYNATTGHFEFGAGGGGGGGAWEPVVTGVDDEAPEFVFEDGDIVVEFVRD